MTYSETVSQYTLFEHSLCHFWFQSWVPAPINCKLTVLAGLITTRINANGEKNKESAECKQKELQFMLVKTHTEETGHDVTL